MSGASEGTGIPAEAAKLASPPAAPPDRPSGHPHRLRSRRSIALAGGAIAAAALVVVALFAAGVLSLGGTGSGGAYPFSEARQAAESSLDQRTGGNWTAIAASGVDERAPASVTFANASSFLGANCSPVPPSGPPGPASLAVPTYTGAWSSGLSPFWIVVLKDLATSQYGIAAVVDGEATASAVLNGTGCATSLGSFTPLPPPTADSPSVAGTAWRSGGSSFVGADPNLTAETMAAVGSYTHGGVTVSRVWIVEYAACGPFVTGATSPAAFVAVLNLTTAAFETTFSTSTPCPA